MIKITQDNSVSISILLDQRSQAENKLAEFKSKTEADILSKCVEIQQQTRLFTEKHISQVRESQITLREKWCTRQRRVSLVRYKRIEIPIKQSN